MKLDPGGVVSGLENIEHIKGVFSKKDADEYFRRLRDEIPWSQISWSPGQPLPRLVFNYKELERQTCRQEVLEELIFLIEETFETGVRAAQCNYYRNGDDFRPYHQDNRRRHTFILSLGHPRKMAAKEKDSPEGKMFRLSGGDIFYASSKANRKYEYSSIREPLVVGPRIEVTFFTDKPYVNRNQRLTFLHILGMGKIPMWVRGSNLHGLPQETIAVILPGHLSQILEGSLAPQIEEEIDFPIQLEFSVNLI